MVQAYEGPRADVLTGARKRREKPPAIVEGVTGRAKADAAKVRPAQVRSPRGHAARSTARVRAPWLAGASQGDGPAQKHVHWVIRTPNGNGYGGGVSRQVQGRTRVGAALSSG